MYGYILTHLPIKLNFLLKNFQVRLSALGLICESHRTTEPPELAQLPLLVEFVELNANSQSPGFRHPVLTAFKKVYIMCVTLYVCLRSTVLS